MYFMLHFLRTLSKMASNSQKVSIITSAVRSLTKTGTAAILAGALVLTSGIALSDAQPQIQHAAARRIVVRPTVVKKAVQPAKRAPVLLPLVDQQDIKQVHRVIADRVFRALPAKCRNTLKDFYVEYDNPQNRGLAGETIMIIAGNVPDTEFAALIIHECGHIIDLGAMRGTQEAGGTEFADGKKPIFADDPSVQFYRLSWDSAKTIKQTSAKTDFVSGYAMSDAFEDFSESFAFYMLQRAEFERLSQKSPILKAKYKFFENMLSKPAPVAIGTFVRGTGIPWDVTKLPYSWTQTVAADAGHASH